MKNIVTQSIVALLLNLNNVSLLNAGEDPARPPFERTDPFYDDDDDDDGFAEMEATYGGWLDAGFDSFDADFSFTKLGVEVEAAFLSVEYGLSDFSWKNADRIDFSNGSSKPWTTLHDLSVEARVPFKLADDKMLLLGFGGGMAWEKETDDAFSLSSEVALLWRISPKWRVLVGIEYEWHPEVDDDDFLGVGSGLSPTLNFSWNEDVEEGFSVQFGVPTEVKYAFGDGSSVSLGLDGAGELARLADDSPVSSGGYSELDMVGLGLTYEREIRNGWELSAGVGYSIQGEWQIYDSSGKRLHKEETGGSLGYRVGFAKSF